MALRCHPGTARQVSATLSPPICAKRADNFPRKIHFNHAILHVCVGLARDRNNKIAKFMDAYLDESGIHQGSPVCVIAGYFGSRGHWARFAKAWRSVQRKFSVPPEQFHANSLLRRRGFFSDWNYYRYDKFLESIPDPFVRCDVRPVSAAVIVDDFMALPLNARMLLTGAHISDRRFRSSGCPNRPYFLPFMEVIRKVAKCAAQRGRANFFLGTDRKFSRYARELYSITQGNPSFDERYRLGTIDFPLASKTPQLQAADLLAYLTYDYICEKKRRRNWLLPPADLLRNILVRGEREDQVYFDDEQMRRMLRATVLPNVPEPKFSRRWLERNMKLRDG